MEQALDLLDVVALTEDVLEHKLKRGQVGTIVEILEPEVFEVEFSDNNGHTYALVALPAAKLLQLHYQTTSAAS
jgi:hypothetical protein